MSRQFLTLSAGVAVSLAGMAQTARPTLDARELYFGPSGKGGSSAAKTVTGDKPKGRDMKRSQASDVDTRNLGIRYNVLLLDPRDGRSNPVDPDRTFKTGDCITIEIQANRGGHLYILAEGASRQWVPLFPSNLATEETNLVNAEVRNRAPAKDCLEFTNPPGTERLFLILLQDSADVRELLRLYQMSSVATPTPESLEAIAKLRSQLASRDLRIKKVEQPGTLDERPFTTYAVAEAPRLFIEVKLKHE